MKGLSFSEPMVIAWLEGRKTVTRRLVGLRFGFSTFLADGELRDAKGYKIKPRYLPGETVYIKEKWRVGAWDEQENKVCIDYAADGFARKEWLSVPDPDVFEKIWIQSTDQARKKGFSTDTDGKYHWGPGQGPTSWRSPMFMPEWASRSHAVIKSVRPERIQAITTEEVILEGVTSRLSFAGLWETIHPGSWEKNSWVWRYELEKLKGAV